MSPSKSLNLERNGDTLVATPVRSLGSLAEAELTNERSALVEEIRRPDVRSVVVDFGKVEYFGSLLLDTLCLTWKHVREQGGNMALCNVPEIGHEILRTARLDSLWTVYPSRSSALDALRGAGPPPTSEETAAGKSP
jgi:anti-anti-sigma factor